MPNVSPRLQVILPADVYAVIDKLARLQGISRSAVARSFLVEVSPVLARVANTLEAAAAMDARGRSKLVRSLEAIQGALEAHADDAGAILDGAIPAAGALRKAGRRPAGARSGDRLPPN